MDYAALAARRDAQVDDRLGDLIFYKRPNDTAWQGPIKGFAKLPEDYLDDADARALDEGADTRKRLKIRKELLPGVPIPSWRFKCAALGDGAEQVWRPQARRNKEVGTYWLFDVSKV